MHAAWIAALLLATVLAGCSEAPPEAPDENFGDVGRELIATEDTGIIRGVVVDQAIVPVEGATVTIASEGLQAESTEDGLFGFDGLEPGTYFLQVERRGFIGVQASVDVAAGVDDPPIVRILLERDITFNPYASTQQYTGFYQCGTNFLVVCGAPGIITEVLLGQEDPIGIDTSTNTFYFDQNLFFLQVEMAWESTQALSPELTYQVEALDQGCKPLEGLGDGEMANAGGPSPQRARVDNATLEHFQIHPTDCGAYLSVFAGSAQGTPVGFSVEQPFDWFITAFYGFAPQDDWWFIHDGSPLVPE